MFTVTPLDVVKIRMQAQKNPFPKGKLELFPVLIKSNLTHSFFVDLQENVLCFVMAWWIIYVSVRTAIQRHGTKHLVVSPALR